MPQKTTFAACDTEQSAATVLGYTQASWDDTSRQARKPLLARKPWRALTDNEKAAAELLGYTEINWDNKSGGEPKPEATKKKWDELTLCTEGECTLAA